MQVRGRLLLREAEVLQPIDRPRISAGGAHLKGAEPLSRVGRKTGRKEGSHVGDPMSPTWPFSTTLMYSVLLHVLTCIPYLGSQVGSPVTF